MRLDRKTRVNADLQVVTVGCSDDLCSPTWATREYLKSHGVIVNIPDSNVHPVRNAGGVFTGNIMWESEPEKISSIREHIMRQIAFLIEKKGATMVFITGHNPCAGCNSINISLEKQQQGVIEFAKEVFERFNVKAIAMIEEHTHGDCNDHYAVLKEFEVTKNVTRLATAA